MATTKKAGSTAKKKTTTKVKSAPAAKPSTTKVTTVKAVATEVHKAPRKRFANRSFIASALIAEFVGTFMLTTSALGAQGNPFYLAFAIAGVVLAVGAISGAHVNPAVTVGAWITRKISTWRAFGYVVAQILGATLAFTAFNIFIASAGTDTASTSSAYGSSAPTIFKAATVADKAQWTVFFVELIAATLFTFAVASARRITEVSAKAFGVGLGLLVAGIFATTAAGYVEANSFFNPAIALATQAIDWNQFNAVVFSAYLIAPLIGGVLGFGLRDVLTAGEKVND